MTGDSVHGLRWWELFYEIPRREKDPLGTMRRWHQQYGDVVRIPIRSPSSLSLTNPDDIRHILVTNNSNYRKVGWLILGRRFLGDGILTSSGPDHWHQRTIMQPVFHRQEILKLGNTIVEETELRISGWEEGAAVNLSREMARLTLATVGRAFFSKGFYEVADDLLEAFLTCQRFMSRWTSFLPESLPTPMGIRYRNAAKTIDEIVYALIAEGKASAGSRHDLLSLLLSSKGPDGNPMSDKRIRDEIVTILWAGHETACNGLEWAWHLLSQNPHVESRLHAEVSEVLGDRVPTVDDLQHLKYTEMVWAEVLRKYPPAWVLARWALADDRLESGIRIPKGTILFISPYAVHHDPRFFPEPDRFDPERFSASNRASRPSLSYIPFGAGQRVCIGEHFGRMEGTLVLATIARRFRLGMVEGSRVQPDTLLTLRMKNDLHMRPERISMERISIPCLPTTAS